MLGERRSKAAFSAGFPEAVREETRQDSGHLPEEIMETEASLDGLDGGEETEENLQNDSLSEQTCEGQMHGKEDIWSEEEDIEDPLRTQKTGGRSLRTHELSGHHGHLFPVFCGIQRQYEYSRFRASEYHGSRDGACQRRFP